MSSTFNFQKEHPLKKKIRERKIKLWHLRDMTGVSESKLSRYLNKVDPIPVWLEQGLERIIKLYDELEQKKLNDLGKRVWAAEGADAGED